MSSSPKVSVVIPIFRAEKFIERCARSLFSQSLQEMEFIFVNDASPDKSIECINNVLADFPNRKNQVILLNHETNKGVAQARQTGIEAVSGQYTIHCDPDDWVDSRWAEALYKEAIRTNADMVSCDYIAEYQKKRVLMQQRPRTLSVSEMKKGLTKNIWGGVWNKLIKTVVFKNRVSFNTDLHYQEDLLFCYMCLCNCQL